MRTKAHKEALNKLIEIGDKFEEFLLKYAKAEYLGGEGGSARIGAVILNSKDSFRAAKVGDSVCVQVFHTRTRKIKTKKDLERLDKDMETYREYLGLPSPELMDAMDRDASKSELRRIYAAGADKQLFI